MGASVDMWSDVWTRRAGVEVVRGRWKGGMGEVVLKGGVRKVKKEIHG